MAIRRVFPLPHEFYGSFSGSVESSTTTRNSTIIPIIMNDDAQGDPMDTNVHPEHLSWTQSVMPNCHSDSTIKNMKITIDFIVPKLLAGQLPNVSVDYGLISCAFPEDLDSVDEVSGLSLKTIAELQKETTDRQCYPLWSAVDMNNGSLLGSMVPGLSGGQVIEGVNWSTEVYRDQRRYGTVKGLLKKIFPIGVRTLVVRNPYATGGHKRLTFNFVPRNAKFINPYTFLGVLIHIRQMSELNLIDPTIHQLGNISDTTVDGSPLVVAWHAQYDEDNPEFHMAKI